MTVLDTLLQSQGPVLLTGPVGPDGDSLGACLALQRVLRSAGRAVWVAGVAPDAYRSLPGIDGLIADEHVAQMPPFAAVVVLDGDRHRLTPPVDAAFRAAAWRGIIDHHASTHADGYDAAWLEPDAASTCEMLVRAFDDRGIPLDRDLAQLLYAGVIFDTGGFRHTNTTPQTHRLAARLLETGFDHTTLSAQILVERRPEALRLAAEVFAAAVIDGPLAFGTVPHEAQARLGLRAGDLEGLIDALVHVRGVDAACLFVERPDGAVKLSLRSRGALDVAALAARLAPTGGGHAKAAGVTIPGPLHEATHKAVGALSAARAQLTP